MDSRPLSSWAPRRITFPRHLEKDELFDGRTPIVWFIKWRDYRPILELTDKYTGECRRACVVTDHPEKMCTNFRIPFALAIIRLLKPRRWLDPCAGWGDRLIAACAMDVRYVGIDPNPCLRPGYEQIIAKYGSSDKQMTIEGQAERVLPKLPSSSFDMVLTSPPFFVQERYTSAPGQSIHGKASEKEWWEGFMRPVLRESIRILEPGGHLVLYIGGTWVAWALRYLNARLAYRGQVHYTENPSVGHLRSAFIWRKHE